MNKKFDSNILIIDDDLDILTSAELFLEENFNKVITESDPRKIIKIIIKHDIEIIILDMNFRKGEIEGHEGIFWLEKIKSEFNNVVIILMTAFGDVDIAVEGIKKGAFEFILKPWKNAKRSVKKIKFRLAAPSKKRILLQRQSLRRKCLFLLNLLNLSRTQS